MFAIMQEMEDDKAPFRAAATKVVATSRKPVEIAAEWVTTLRNAIRVTQPSPQKSKAKVILNCAHMQSQIYV